MKKILIAAAIIAASTMAAQASEYQPDVSGIYPMTATVAEIDQVNDLVTFEDASGFLWGIYGSEDWSVGDVASLLMYGNGTEEIFDDMILAARYSGYIRPDFQE